MMDVVFRKVLNTLDSPPDVRLVEFDFLWRKKQKQLVNKGTFFRRLLNNLDIPGAQLIVLLHNKGILFQNLLFHHLKRTDDKGLALYKSLLSIDGGGMQCLIQYLKYLSVLEVEEDLSAGGRSYKFIPLSKWAELDRRSFFAFLERAALQEGLWRSFRDEISGVLNDTKIVYDLSVQLISLADDALLTTFFDDEIFVNAMNEDLAKHKNEREWKNIIARVDIMKSTIREKAPKTSEVPKTTKKKTAKRRPKSTKEAPKRTTRIKKEKKEKIDDLAAVLEDLPTDEVAPKIPQKRTRRTKKTKKEETGDLAAGLEDLPTYEVAPKIVPKKTTRSKKTKKEKIDDLAAVLENLPANDISPKKAPIV
jgi:hypothetical protein